MAEIIKSSADQPIGWAPYASVTLTTAGDFAISGLVGGAVGFAIGLVDEYFIAQKKSEKHFKSRSSW
jgi:hypothetical protein